MLVTSGEIAALEPLMQALKDENQEIRKDAAMALGRFGDVRAIASLVDALKDTYVYVRFEAAIALGYIKDIRSVKPLVKAFTGALKNGDDTLLYAAINSLVKLGDLSVSALSQAFNAEDIMLCNWIIPTLARIYSSRALEALINLLKDENNDLWLHIIIYLIDFEDELVLSTLTRLYETSSNKVIIRAVSDAIKFLQTGEKVDLQQYLRPQTS